MFAFCHAQLSLRPPTLNPTTPYIILYPIFFLRTAVILIYATLNTRTVPPHLFRYNLSSRLTVSRVLFLEQNLPEYSVLFLPILGSPYIYFRNNDFRFFGDNNSTLPYRGVSRGGWNTLRRFQKTTNFSLKFVVLFDTSAKANNIF